MESFSKKIGSNPASRHILKRTNRDIIQYIKYLKNKKSFFFFFEIKFYYTLSITPKRVTSACRVAYLCCVAPRRHLHRPLE